MENRDVSHKKVGNGFADVAGMEDLKTQLQSDVIDLLQHPKEAKDLGLSIPTACCSMDRPDVEKHSLLKSLLKKPDSVFSTINLRN